MPNTPTQEKLSQANNSLMAAWSLICEAEYEVNREQALELQELLARIDKLQNHLADIQYELGAHPIAREYGPVSKCNCSGSEAR